jgi:ribose/xylose/arabinose/galactoside ABC-type transport system permease subunit
MRFATAVDRIKLGRFANLAGLLAALILIFAFFWWRMPTFASWRNIELIARQTTIVSLAALGMTLVIVSGAIDLSIGSMVALVTVVIAWCLREGAHPLLACLAGIGVALLCGLLNGTLVTRLKVGAFIVTLGALLIFRGAAKGLANEKKIDAPAQWLPDILAVLPPERKWMIFPPGVWLMALFAVLTALLLGRTRFGRHIVAVGSNENAARLCGVPVERVRLGVFVLMGFFAGLAGLMQFSRLTVGEPTVAVGLELDVIAAVVIGGASLSGGTGTIVGSLVGAFIMSTIRAGSNQMGWANWVQEIVTGAIIILAVAIDRLRIGKGGRET